MTGIGDAFRVSWRALAEECGASPERAKQIADELMAEVYGQSPTSENAEWIVAEIRRRAQLPSP